MNIDTSLSNSWKDIFIWSKFSNKRSIGSNHLKCSIYIFIWSLSTAKWSIQWNLLKISIETFGFVISFVYFVRKSINSRFSEQKIFHYERFLGNLHCWERRSDISSITTHSHQQTNLQSIFSIDRSNFEEILIISSVVNSFSPIENLFEIKVK